MSRPKRYIEEKKVIDTVNYWWRTAVMADGRPTLCDEIRALPAADVEPIVHARWENDGHGHIFCTNCNNVALTLHKSKRCPDCGARMDGE